MSAVRKASSTCRKVMSEFDVKLGLKLVSERLENACERRPEALKYSKPILVAVSKTKPAEDIISAYSCGQRHFGENYVQELEEKGKNEKILEICKDIKWHFIGHLQRNKINKVLNTPGIYIIETVDSQKLADSLHTAWNKIEPSLKTHGDKLKVMIQVNTSGEVEKNGVSPDEVLNLYKHVSENCPSLSVDGIMTIGKFGYDCSQGPNPDFVSLKRCRDVICEELKLDLKDVNLSMGMSDDFEQAIEMGSTNVRVGSAVFGYRPKKNVTT